LTFSVVVHSKKGTRIRIFAIAVILRIIINKMYRVKVDFTYQWIIINLTKKSSEVYIMRRIFAFVLAFMLMLCLFSFGVSANEDLVIDISKVEGKAGFNQNSPLGLWPAAGYDDKHVIAMCNFGSYASLGEIDLSKYEAIVVTYARGQDVDYASYNTAFGFTNKGAMQTAGGEKVSDEDAGVITKYVFEGSVSGGWQGRVDVTLELNSDYNGEVFVANYLDPAFPHGFVITDIRFVAKQNPETSDMGMIPLVVLTLTGFVPLKRRRVK